MCDENDCEWMWCVCGDGGVCGVCDFRLLIGDNWWWLMGEVSGVCCEIVCWMWGVGDWWGVGWVVWFVWVVCVFDDVCG